MRINSIQKYIMIVICLGAYYLARAAGLPAWEAIAICAAAAVGLGILKANILREGNRS
jgi:hypothetical protein